MIPLAELMADPWLHVEGQLTVTSGKPRVVLSLRAGGESALDCLDCSPPAGEFVWSNRGWAMKPYQDTPRPGWLSW